MATVVTAYHNVQDLLVTGLSTLANAASAQSSAVVGDGAIDYLIRATITTAAGAAARGTVSIAVRDSIDGTDYDDASNEEVIATIALPVAGAQTRSATFALTSGSLIPPNWALSFRNSCGDSLTAASVRYIGVTRQPDTAVVRPFSLGFSSGWS